MTTTAFSISAAGNIILNSGYTFDEAATILTKLVSEGKAKDGYILSADLPAIKSIQ